LFFYLQKYIEKKVSPGEKLPWVQSVISKGFTGEIRLISSPITLEMPLNYVMHILKVKEFILIC